MTSFLQTYGPAVGSGIEAAPALSADGRFLARTTVDTLYIRDLTLGTERAIPIPYNSPLNGTSLYAPDMSADGKWVAALAFSGGEQRLALFETATGSARVLPIQIDGKDVFNLNSPPSISGDGRTIAITANNNQVILIDTLSGAARRVEHQDPASITSFMGRPELSDDGSALLYSATGTGYASYGPTLNLLRLATGETTQVNGVLPINGADGSVAHGMMSGDARFVVFDSLNAKLPGDTNGVSDIYLNDTRTGTISRVSSSAYASSDPAISADGRFVTFTNAGDDLIAGTVKGTAALYRKDLQTGELSVLSAPGGAAIDLSAATLSADGSQVAFLQRAIGGQAPAQVWLSRIGDVGGPGNETLVGAAGNQHLQGGAGIDTVAYHGSRAQYTVSRSAVTDSVAGRDGADTLAGVERLRFTDTSVALDVDGTAGQAYRIYQAAFNRTPDAAGLGYWIAQMDAGASLQAVAGQFAASAEFKALYGTSASSSQIVDKLYSNVLHRAGEAAGKAYWTDVLNKNPAALPEVLANFTDSPENVASLVGVMSNGVAYIPYG